MILDEPFPTLEALGVSREILEAAEEIADASDVPGIERSRLEYLLRLVIVLDRRSRPLPEKGG